MGSFKSLTFFLSLTLFIFAHSEIAQARGSIIDLELTYDYQLVPEPLNTEKIWSLDPSHKNPHRARWIIQRHSELMGMEVYAKKENQFGVRAKGIQTTARGYVRGPGPWYHSWNEFGCVNEPDSWFGTGEGTKVAAASASALWMETIKNEKVKLSLLLERISADSQTSALDQGMVVFRDWLRKSEATWRMRSETKARRDEWTYYLSQSKSQNLCPEKPHAHKTSPPWKSMMEPVAVNSTPTPTLSARAPARVWSGYYTVRVNITVLGRTLNGRFAIDSGLDKSVISPEWIAGQGITPVWVTIPGESFQRIRWGSLRGSESDLARLAKVEKTEISGLVLPLSQFLIAETDLFDPPESVGSCCSGILGQDFLRLYPMEFDPQAPTEVRIWSKENFKSNSISNWIEVDEDHLKMPLSSQGRFIIDLPHGRLWSALGASGATSRGLRKNKTGVDLKFELRDGDRVLKVARIAPHSMATTQTLGLRPGMIVTQIDGKPAEEMDEWEVERRLAGDHGDTVTLQWKVNGELKIAPIKLN